MIIKLLFNISVLAKSYLYSDAWIPDACRERELNVSKTVAFPADILTKDTPHTKQERYAFYRDVRRTYINARVILNAYDMPFRFIYFMRLSSHIEFEWQDDWGLKIGKGLDDKVIGE